MSSAVSRWRTVRARTLPSGDQDDGTWVRSLLVRASNVPLPSADFQKMSGIPTRGDAKLILLPSGPRPAPSSKQRQGSRTRLRPRTHACPLTFHRPPRRTPTHPHVCPPACPSPAPGSCKRQSPGSLPPPFPGASRLETARARRRPSPLYPPRFAFAKPKSNTLTVPSSLILTLVGFRSRWITPSACAASRASAIW